MGSEVIYLSQAHGSGSHQWGGSTPSKRAEGAPIQALEEEFNPVPDVIDFFIGETDLNDSVLLSHTSLPTQVFCRLDPRKLTFHDLPLRQDTQHSRAAAAR